MRGSAGFRAIIAAAVLLVACDGTVVETIPVESVDVTPAEVTLFELEDVNLDAELRGPGGQRLEGREIQWSVSDDRVAEINASGSLRALSAGQTLARAESEGVVGVASITVRAGARIGLDSPSVSFSGQTGRTTPLTTSMGVSNDGNGTLSGLSAQAATEDGQDWLEAELGSGTAPTQLTIRAHVGDLSAGVYQGTVEVTSPVAANSPRTVAVTLEVRETPPRIGLSPLSVAFSAAAGSREPAAQAVQVTNLGEGTLLGLQVEVVYLSGGASGWLHAELAGSLAPTDLMIEALARDLGPGTYRALVRVSSAVAVPERNEVEVVFNVSPAQ